MDGYGVAMHAYTGGMMLQNMLLLISVKRCNHILTVVHMPSILLRKSTWRKFFSQGTKINP